jgi:hypothetical protein
MHQARSPVRQRSLTHLCTLQLHTLPKPQTHLSQQAGTISCYLHFLLCVICRRHRHISPHYPLRLCTTSLLVSGIPCDMPPGESPWIKPSLRRRLLTSYPFSDPLDPTELTLKVGSLMLLATFLHGLRTWTCSRNCLTPYMSFLLVFASLG